MTLREVRLWQGRRVAALSAGDAVLSDRSHAYEPDLDLLWANGEARPPATPSIRGSRARRSSAGDPARETSRTSVGCDVNRNG
jgi:hypothetical protein